MPFTALPLEATGALSDGITALGSIYSFLSQNAAFSAMIGIAVATVGAGAFLGLFFRR